MSDVPNHALSGPEQETPYSHENTAGGAQSTDPPKKTPNYVKWIALIIIAAVLVGTAVWFFVANSNKRDVPDLVGMDYATAEELLRDAGPKLSANPSDIVERVPGKFIEIVAQDPKPGSRIHFEDLVEVSVKPREVQVPDVIGLTLAQSKNKLADAGLLVARLNSIPEELDDQVGDKISMWKVTEQSIESRARVDAGTGIALSLDIPDVTVPALKPGDGTVSDLETAQAAFVKQATGEFARELLIPTFKGKGYAPLSVSPAMGDSIPAFTEVSVTLGIPMPDIVGEEILATEAISKLESMGFSNIIRGHEDNTQVVSQSIAAGTVVSTDAEIRLENKPKGYTYRVTGKGSLADITWSQPGSFDIQQANGTSLPWERVFDPEISGSGYLSAFLTEGGIEVTCQIIKDGVVIKENTSTGPYAMVSCD